MIGFQCAPNPAPGAGKSVDQQQQTAAPSGASSPASRRSSASSSSSSSSSCSTGSSPRDLAGRLHQQLPSIQQHSSHSLSSNSKHLHNNGTGEQCAEERELRAASPGYHSAAPSPGGSTSSSIASPISSSASTSSTSVCSSSGISTASLLSAASAHSSAALLQQQSPITTTARSTHRPSHPQHQHHQLHPPTSNNVGPSLAPHQMSQQLEVPHMQQQTNSYEPMVRTQQQQQQQHQRNNNQQRQANGLGALLDHFVQAHHEPLNLSWFHEANNRAALNAALSSTKLMVAGDISLAEMSRYPVPIMARPPLGVSDLTLENWITDVLQARKGIKLTFTSTRTVEPAFRVLARHADQLRGPLVLSADVLAWPQAGGLQGARNQAPSNKQQQQQPVDAWTFLMLCRTRFPKSIISIGWCGGASSTCGQPCESSPADSNVGQPESMFELELLEQHSQGQHQFNSPVLHLSQAGRPQCHQPLALQPHGALLNRQLLQAGRAAQFGNPSCASNGSLNSSSGNSSGSPSPTSPVSSSSLFLGASGQSQVPRLRHHQRNQLPIGEPAGSSAEQLIMAAAAAAAAAHEHKSSGSPSSGQHLKGGWSAVAAAAMVAQLQQQHHHHQDQLPLNLNINEAAESQQAVASLQELAHTIQQLQQQSSSLESLSTSLHHQQQCSKATAAALALAGNIAQANATNPHTGHAHQLLIGQLREAQKWQHVNKKAAVSNRLHSNSPSPISTSPKQAPASAINLLSYVSSGANKLLNNAPSGQHNNNNKQQQQPEVAGYTREMIDKMSSLVKEYNLTQAITFPVEARLLVRRHSAHFAHSLTELQRLLFQVGPNSTLTLVAQPEDLISADELLLIRKHFSPNQILFDLPGELAQAVRQHELSTSGGHR